MIQYTKTELTGKVRGMLYKYQDLAYKSNTRNDVDLDGNKIVNDIIAELIELQQCINNL